MSGKKKTRASKDLDPKEMTALVQAAAVSEQEIADWHADFLEQYPSGRLDRKAFIEYARKLQANAEGEASLSWDGSGDGYIQREELSEVLSAIYDRAGVFDRKNERDPKRLANGIIAKLDLSGDKKLSKDEFIQGCKSDPVLRNLLAPHATT